MPTIRHATISDAPQLAQLAEATFRATFAAMNTAEDMELHCQTSYSEALQIREIVDPHRLTLLCEEQGALIGFAQLHWDDKGTQTPACITATHPGEIQRLYVAADWHGKGVAQALMDACLAEMKQAGADMVWLGVWEHNPRAITFYQKYGFVPVGDHVFPLGNDPQRDIIMAKSLLV
jgi:diamine N-acetyltransferase